MPEKIKAAEAVERAILESIESAPPKPAGAPGCAKCGHRLHGKRLERAKAGEVVTCTFCEHGF